jgi:DivIVA domain-containing protein
MPLTPEDVHKKTFTPVRLREGYDMGEVDQFLDEVEEELTRLLKENSDLRGQLAAVATNGSRAAVAAPEPAPAPPPAPEPAPVVPQQAQPAALTELPLVKTAPEASSAAARLLEIATSNAEQLVHEAKSDADRIVVQARTQADRVGKDAQSKADKLTTEARKRAQRLDAETEERREQMLGTLEREKQSLAAEIDELRAFEREYRSRLKSYFEAQLRALEGDGETDDVPLTPSANGETSERIRELLSDRK